MGRLLQFLADKPASQQEIGTVLRCLSAPGQDLKMEDLQPAQPPKSISFREDSFFWAFCWLPIVEALKGLFLCGCIGSGKTSIIQLLLQSIAARFLPSRARAENLIILDVKCELLPLLAALGLKPNHKNFWILNPFDKRGAILSIAEATKVPAMIRYVAGLLVPRELHSTAPYFSDAARELIIAVILALNLIKGRFWTLRDLLCALDSREHIVGLTRRHPRAKIRAERILNDEKHSDGVLSTLGTKLGDYETIAALSATGRSRKPFTMDRFFGEPGVLVLGSDPFFKASLAPIVDTTVTTASNYLLRQPETDVTKAWFVLDEGRTLDKAESIKNLANYGRSKGVCVVLTAQSIEGLIEIYGEPATNDLLSHLTNKTFLRAGGVQTAEWAERYFGKVRSWEPSYSRTQNPHSSDSFGTTFALQDRPILLSSVFLDMPLPGPGRPFCAVSDMPYYGGPILSERPFEQVLSWRTRPATDVPAIIRRTKLEEQTLQPWTKEEEDQFCGQGPETGDSKPPSAPASPPYLPKRPRKKGDPSQGHLF